MRHNTKEDLLKIDKKLSLSFGLLILFVLLSIFFASVGYFHYVMTKEQNRFGSVIANGIGTAINSVSFSGKYQARLLIENLQKENENIDSIIIQDSSGLVIGHSDKQYNGKYINDDNFQKAKQVMQLNTFFIHNVNIQKDKQLHSLIEIDIPYKKGYGNNIVGVIRVLISTDAYDKLKFNGLLYLSVLVLILVIISYILISKLSNHFSQPIKNLAFQLNGILKYAPLSIHIKNNKEEIVASSEVFHRIEDDIIKSVEEKKYDKLVFDTKGVYRYPFSVNRNGNIKYYNAIKCPISMDSRGDVSLTSTIIINMTEQVLILKQNEMQAIRLESLVNSIPDLVWMKDEMGKYLHCNNRFGEFFGASSKEIIGKTDYDFVDKELADSFRRNDANAMNSSKPVKNFEEITFISDGHVEYLETIKTAVRDKDGALIGVLGVGRDITTIKQQHEKLLVQKEEFETIFRNSKDAIAIIDMELNFLDFNDAFVELVEYSREELLSKNCLDITLSQREEVCDEVFANVLKNGYVENYEKSWITKTNSTVLVNMSLAMMPDKKRVLLSMKNITQLKLMEQQAKLASMGDMIGNIAHQWRQPLSIISTSATGMLFQKQHAVLSDEEFAQYCKFINDNAQYLSRTIDDFRDFIKGESEKSLFNLTENINSFIQLVEGSMKTHHIQVVLDLDDTIEVYGVSNELIQCLMNIYNNAKDALKDMDEEHRFFFINTSLQEQGKITINIKDNGGGIDEKIIDKIFEPYFTTKHQSQGTGLGLHMSYNLIVDSMDGSLEAYNCTYFYKEIQYKGAEFIITLPSTS